MDLLSDGLVGSPCSPRDSQESSPTPQFQSISSSALSFLLVQLSHPYMTTGKTIALTRRTFVGKVMSLLFNMLSRLVITFLQKSKCLIFVAAVTICSDFGAPKIKSATVSLSICQSRDITLPTKVLLVKAMVFPMVIMDVRVGLVKKAEHRRIDAFELWCWRRLLRAPWTARRSNQSILKEISPGCSLERLMLKLKL